ncbi:MAG: site-2 protease family protein [Gammaproteobacteria bacterium]|nr:site-2 protease family protein [Gammaproteobacteria bacterium]MDH5630521.1 site-2 protease family protein [Gammaproteobacteria bacterium]
MIKLLFDGQVNLFIIYLIAIIISLTFHEFGHALVAKIYGDDTPQRMGRLTLNPVPHIDPMGLLMVAVIGFGYARPVQTNPRNYNSRYAPLWIAAAGPGMNLLLAFICINLQVGAWFFGIDALLGAGPQKFLQFMAFINLLLMLFNLLPIGPLDGHYILPYFMQRENAIKYDRWNAQYGHLVFLSLVVLSLMGLPIFTFLLDVAGYIASYLIIF